MPQPEGAQLSQGISPMLTQLAIGYLPTLTQYVAGQVFPTIPVASPVGQFNVWTAGDFLRRGGKELSNYEAPPIEGFASSTGTYSTGKWGVSTVYTAQDLATARVGGTSSQQLRLAKMRFVVTRGVIEREITVAAKVQTAANWSTTGAGVASGPTGTQFLRWDVTSSDPVADVLLRKTAFTLATGQVINRMVIPRRVMDALLKNVSIMDRIKYGGTMDNPSKITIGMIKALFEIDDIVIPAGVYNSAKEGAADNITWIWNDTVWMGVVNPTPSMDTPSAGYNFAWNGDTTAGLPQGIEADDGPQDWGAVKSEEGLFIRSYVLDRPQGRFIDCMKFDNPNVVAASLGTTFTTPIS